MIRIIFTVFFLFLAVLPAGSNAQASGLKKSRSVRCIGCHSSLKGKNYLHTQRYLRSVHGDLSCLECHDARRIGFIDAVHRESVGTHHFVRPSPPSSLRVKSAFPDALSACRECHRKVFRAVKRSVHGKALFEKHLPDGAFCTDCHIGIHYLEPIAAVASSVARDNVIETCSRCHANEVIASRYNLNVYVVQSYKAHFHGKKYSLGSEETPTCIACHGHHAILDVKDPQAYVAPGNKVALCSRCHKGATPAFAAAFTHEPFNAANNPLAFQVRRLLLLLLGMIVVLLGLHILLELYGQSRRRKVPRTPPHVAAGLSWSFYRRLPKEVERMDLHLRIQHALLFVSILYLGASGLALKFPAMRFSRIWIRIWGGVENSGHLHRFAALILIMAVLYHLGYLIVMACRRRLRFSMVPKASDLRLFLQNVRYLSGRSSTPPPFEKFTYTQKLDYWLVALVVVLMMVTGLMYWFPEGTARLLPRQAATWLWGVAYVVHSTEALLVLFVAFVWHFYNVHLKSRVFPMSWVWITGKIGLEDLFVEHRGEFKKCAVSKETGQNGVHPEKTDPPGTPIS